VEGNLISRQTGNGSVDLKGLEFKMIKSHA